MEGIEESILTGFNIAIFNESRIKNADIITGITKDETETKLSISNVQFLNKTGVGKDYYSSAIFDELKNHYIMSEE